MNIRSVSSVVCMVILMVASAGWGHPASAATWRLQSDSIVFELRDDSGHLMTVKDRAAGYTWHSVSSITPARVESAKISDGKIRSHIRVRGERFPVAFSLGAAGAGLIIEIDAPDTTGANEILSFPPALAGGDRNSSLVIPCAEGILLPAQDVELADRFNLMDDEFGVYDPKGLSMPWFGETNMKNGYIAVFETPYAAGMKLGIRAGRFVAQPKWNQASVRQDYPRRIRYVFVPEGGYVALAKYYRAYAFSAGVHGKSIVPRLADEVARNPEVGKLAGALHWWDAGTSTPAFYKALYDSGVKKLLVQSVPGGPESVRSASEVKQIRGRGWLAGRYDAYMPMYVAYPNRPRPEWLPLRGGIYAYDARTAIIAEDGRPWVEETFGGLLLYRRCASHRWKISGERIKADLSKVPSNARFIDMEGAADLAECRSPEHPMTREQDATLRGLLLRQAKSRGIVVGTELGHDYVVGSVHYIDGMEMLSRFMDPGMTSDMRGGKIETPDTFVTFILGEKYRVPLYQLVYHDYVVSAWGRTNTANRFQDEMYWKKYDLFQVLYGTPPVVLGTAGQLNARMARVLRTCMDVGSWHGKIAFDELVDHKFVTPDCAVQSTRFGSGRSVTVNFGSEPYRMPSGRIIPPLEYILSPH